jgi:hypothetical protein
MSLEYNENELSLPLENLYFFSQKNNYFYLQTINQIN